MNLRLVPYIKNKTVTGIEQQLCEQALEQMHTESASDRLGANYTKWLRLERMEIFTFVFDEFDNPVQASGCQIMSDNVVRVCSRYYVFNDFRKQSSDLLDKLDDFMDLKYAVANLKDYPLIIWSRDKSAGFFKRLKKGRPDIFSNWNVYDSEVEILWKDNVQHVFYIGDISYIDEIKYSA